MTASLNAFFAILVESVQQFGGDVVKFAGDALFCQVISCVAIVVVSAL
jgi:class 3 adenylate cyclase